ncbi:MFS transporter [Cryobacterium sp. 1639]|uniref:MFS transporter n=1 Tax=Cryobacterium inferilacus TaxID=2866629 RepID=UPI0021038558|nr:MFS transporter [Cryobacterium sp. 1639]
MQHKTDSSELVSLNRESWSAWAVVGGLSLVTMLLLLDDTAVSVALPSIQRQLGFGLGTLEWVVNAYTLTIAVFTLLGGHLADRRGASRIFLLGVAIFVVGSLVAGLASNVAILVASRAIQGFGAALVGPSSLSLIATAFSDRRRGVALGVWAGVSASALGLGPLIGAYITDTLGWNWIFLLNVPLGAVAWLIARAVLPRSPRKKAAHRIDLLGASLSGLGLVSLLLALSQANMSAWTAPAVIALFGLSALSFGLFVFHERRVSNPLVDLALFRNRFFTGANIVALLSTAVMCSLFFFLALYLQTVVGLSALESGVALLPLTLTIIFVAPLAGRLPDRIGAYTLIVGGMVVLAGGLLGMSRLDSGTNIASLMAWLAITGLGIALARTPTTTMALSTADESDSHGIAAGVYNTSQATGLALGISIMSIILTAFGPQAAFSREFSAAHHAAFISGFSTALAVNGVIALLAAVFAAIVLRPQKANGSERRLRPTLPDSRREQ